jgi:hypothetical protein
LGYIYGDFFRNSSGHPKPEPKKFFIGRGRGRAEADENASSGQSDQMNFGRKIAHKVALNIFVKMNTFTSENGVKNRRKFSQKLP